jgi:uncharacterized membrane protein
MTAGEILRMIFGGLFVLFIPGLAWSYVFFLRKNIDWIERVTISFGLSIALVPLSVFWLNWVFDMKITLLSTSLTVCGLIVIAVFFILARKFGWGTTAFNKIKTLFSRSRKEQES